MFYIYNEKCRVHVDLYSLTCTQRLNVHMYIGHVEQCKFMINVTWSQQLSIKQSKAPTTKRCKLSQTLEFVSSIDSNTFKLQPFLIARSSRLLKFLSCVNSHTLQAPTFLHRNLSHTLQVSLLFKSHTHQAQTFLYHKLSQTSLDNILCYLFHKLKPFVIHRSKLIKVPSNTYESMAIITKISENQTFYLIFVISNFLCFPLVSAVSTMSSMSLLLILFKSLLLSMVYVAYVSTVVCLHHHLNLYRHR